MFKWNKRHKKWKFISNVLDNHPHHHDCDDDHILHLPTYIRKYKSERIDYRFILSYPASSISSTSLHESGNIVIWIERIFAYPASFSMSTPSVPPTTSSTMSIVSTSTVTMMLSFCQHDNSNQKANAQQSLWQEFVLCFCIKLYKG